TETATTKTYTLSLHDALPISISQKCGIAGGVMIYTGFDANRNGVLDETEYSPSTAQSPNPQILCNGQPAESPDLGIGGLCRRWRSEEHTSELQSRENLVCRLL